MSSAASPRVAAPDAAGVPYIVPPRKVLSRLESHILVDGFKLIFDPRKSRGSMFVDAATGQHYLDLYGFYASQPIGFNHPHLSEPESERRLLEAAKVKVANADVYTSQYATFVETFARVVGTLDLPRYFFIEGGALAVENALKAAMDWKVRKNLARAPGERGTEVLHFEKAFHGRSGYTLSLTNTDPKKVALFAKFPWPRVPAPAIDFSLPAGAREQEVAARETAVSARLDAILRERGTDIACVIIETIQGEGGDNHFRGEFLRRLRHLCDAYEVLLVFDEVQCGMGITGRNWCCQHFGVVPDLLCFGKKSQVCGVMAGPRLDEVEENCFRLPGRISSTWGGNFTDFVRSTLYLEVIEREHLVENAATQGERFLAGLEELAARHPIMTAVRGRGLMLAFDLPDPASRDAFWKGAYQHGLLVIRSGERSIRLRPVLDIQTGVIEEALSLMEKQLRKMS